MAHLRHHSRQVTVAFASCCALFALLLAVALSGCATPPTAQSNSRTLNVLTSSSVQIPANTLSRFRAQTDVTVHVTVVTDEALRSTVTTATAGRFDVVVGLDLMGLTALNARLLPYDSINGGHGSDDYAAAFGNSGTAITHTAVCAQSATAKPVKGLKLNDLGASSHKQLVTIADPSHDAISNVWQTAIENNFGASDWQRIAKAQQPFMTVGTQSKSTRPVWIAPVGHPFTDATTRQPKSAPATAASSHSVRGTCVRWAQYMSILKTGAHINAAMKFVDALLSAKDQHELANRNLLYPVTNDVSIPTGLPDLNTLDLLPLTDADTAGIDQ